VSLGKYVVADVSVDRSPFTFSVKQFKTLLRLHPGLQEDLTLQQLCLFFFPAASEYI
jgi:hypothetical protein